MGSELAESAAASTHESSSPNNETKKLKTEKKAKKRKSKDSENDEGKVHEMNEDTHDDDNGKEHNARNSDDGETISRKEKSKRKRQDKKSILESLPKLNEEGISYTKHQLRRMVKRVQSGLKPIPTAQEEQERRRYEAQVRREEEELLFTGETPLMKKQREADGENSGDDDNENNNDDGDNDGDNDPKEQAEQVVSPSPHKRKRSLNDDSEDHNADDDGNGDGQGEVTDEKGSQHQSKKKARAKEVPSDYVCQACKNECAPPRHWIYDCPKKVTVKGRNKVAKKLRGLHDPDPRKVFVTGLPFDASSKGVIAIFDGANPGHPVDSCKLVTFPDTGRCKGMAYLTFDTAEGANKALKLSGISVPAVMNPDDKKAKQKKKDKPKDDSERKTLRLKVAKVKHRKASKGNA